ncbi:hypothetical protein SELMODRAFT_441100 [Selaginella moellendorffii]|uniref:Regulatory protein RecX n=1 Tax=Selaginella moellendorffii TaxID=88036 RepID=D8RGG7_SELML|nr:uncharacterized protein LOC9632166 isoform X2 [Selaginella moellendorffii]EFJ28355.1 hypothetical protein SELMODRAFT_441100 [Selaginella moellendorffii]|eukprot:XP_002970225.1 uncharacterized protein LOC9632166 isoform X2 [Selaginella moellendorffii]
MALKPIGSWYALGSRHCGRGKWRSLGTARASSSGKKPSQIPSLVRYIPKLARKHDGEILENVHFPRTISSGEDDGEEEEFGSGYFDSDSQAGKKKRKGARFYFDDTEKQRSELGLASFRRNAIELEEFEEGNERNDAVSSNETISTEESSSDREEETSGQQERLPSLHRITKEQPPRTKEVKTSIRKEVLSSLQLVPASRLVSRPRPGPSTAVLDSKAATSDDGIPSQCPAMRLLPASQLNLNPRSMEDDEPEEFDDEEEEDALFALEVQTRKTELPSFPDSGGERTAAKNYAVFLLSKWQRTAAELRKKLSEKNYSVQVTESTIAALREEGLQSDTSFAEVFAQSRWNTRGWGPKRIKHELVRKGVDTANIDRALQKVFKADGDGNIVQDDDDMQWGMSKQAQEHIFALSARKWSSGGNISVQARSRRLAGWLQRRGFSWKVINGIIHILEGNGSIQKSL